MFVSLAFTSRTQPEINQYNELSKMAHRGQCPRNVRTLKYANSFELIAQIFI